MQNPNEEGFCIYKIDEYRKCSGKAHPRDISTEKLTTRKY